MSISSRRRRSSRRSYPSRQKRWQPSHPLVEDRILIRPIALPDSRQQALCALGRFRFDGIMRLSAMQVKVANVAFARLRATSARSARAGAPPQPFELQD
jgi:hypothetical protein